ncbi:hypothetical protein [Rhodococcus artemisiae]|uniref:Uncharacterized protein n=1 Tax=Rhodococcus artemisiae TaxID=714159 RepID=A0ABU7LKZ1_9NOCA|nr:hypothetical protein [Rhodococcus artemisiae]MEE2062205.1 hypothetical protein [Rhodococcus artemisiae]
MLVEAGLSVAGDVEAVSGATVTVGGAAVSGTAVTIGLHGGSGATGVVVGAVVVVVPGAVVGPAHGSVVMVAPGASSGAMSGLAGWVAVVVLGAAGVGSTGWAKAADPPAATISTVVLATRHRRSQLRRGMAEPPGVCESICYLLSFGPIGTAVAPSLHCNLNGFPKTTNATGNTSVTETIQTVCFSKWVQNSTFGAK